jgi:hypothetical protein
MRELNKQNIETHPGDTCSTRAADLTASIVVSWSYDHININV